MARDRHRAWVRDALGVNHPAVSARGGHQPRATQPISVELDAQEEAAAARGFRPTLAERAIGPEHTAADEGIPDELLAHPEDDMRPAADAIRGRQGDQAGSFVSPGTAGVRSRRAGRTTLGHANSPAQVSVGTDLEPQVELSRATQSVDPAAPLGTRRTDTTSVTAGLDSIGVRRERRTGEGDSAQTTNVGEQATFDPNECITGMQVSASRADPGGIKVSTSFGYEIEFSQPTADGERWKVEGEFTWTSTFGRAQSGRSEATASASMRVGQKRRFVRHFDTQTEAQRFRDSYGSWLGPQSFGSKCQGEHI